MNSYELVEKRASWANSNFYDEYDRDRFEFIYRKHYERRIDDKSRYQKEGTVEQKTTNEKWRKYEEIDSYQSIQLPRDFHNSISQHNHHHSENNFRYNENQENELHGDDDHKHYSYCYLCSIKGHVHSKTEPVPLSKRRFLKPYVNPLILMKKYEENQLSTETNVQYKFLVKTGPGNFSGTDSNVFFKLFGTNGNWEQTEIKPISTNKDMKFPPDSLVEVDMNGPIIGDLKKIKIWHNGKTLKEGWHLDYVEINCAKLKKTWKFTCDRLISKFRAPEYKNSALLISNDQIITPEINQNSADYIFMVKTSDRAHLADMNVQFQFVCSKGQSTIFNLISPYVVLFDVQQLDCFLINSSIDLGKPEKLRMAIEHNGKKISNDWSVEELKIFYSNDPNKFYTFKLEKWIEKNGKLNAAITPGPILAISQSDESEIGKMVYHVTVITGNSKMAGTDANVFIEIAGEFGNTSIHRLHNPKARKEFERNQTDHFHLFDNNIGQIKAIRVFHDNSGTAPDWLLDTILIKCVPTSITGKKKEHDSELKDQLEKLRKKIKVRELKITVSESSRSRKSFKRSSSADVNKSGDSKDLPIKRSISAISSGEKHKESSKKPAEGEQLNRQSPTSSILKTSSSPRNQRKTVKFNSKDFYHQLDENKPIADAQTKPDVKSNKLEMNFNWIMSVAYESSNENGDYIKAIKTIENFDKSLRSIDQRHIAKYDSISKEQSKDRGEQINENLRPSTASEDYNFMYVFECKKWLAKNSPDKKIERRIKVTNTMKF